LQALAKERLLDPYYTQPFICHDPWLAGESNVIIALERWAQDDGLRAGDRMVVIGDARIGGTIDRQAAMRRLSKTQPFRVGVRRGREELNVNLDCRDHQPYLSAEREVFESISKGEWPRCMAAADRAMTIFGSKTRPMLGAKLWCLQELGDSVTPLQQAELTYQYAFTAIEEMPYVEPNDRTENRTLIVNTIGKLRGFGFEAFANDLATQLAALNPDNVAHVR
jgi:hypothetical protein